MEAYLTESRKAVDRIYQLQYSDLLRVFSFLLRDDWLEEANPIGLQPEKIADIKRSAEGVSTASAGWRFSRPSVNNRLRGGQSWITNPEFYSFRPAIRLEVRWQRVFLRKFAAEELAVVNTAAQSPDSDPLAVEVYEGNRS